MGTAPCLMNLSGTTDPRDGQAKHCLQLLSYQSKIALLTKNSKRSTKCFTHESTTSYNPYHTIDTQDGVDIRTARHWTFATRNRKLFVHTNLSVQRAPG